MSHNQLHNRERNDRHKSATASTRTAPARGSAVSRRAFLKSLTGVFAGSVTGCAFKRCEIAKNLPFPDLVAHLNRNIEQIHAWQCEKVGIKIRGTPIIVPSLNATLAIEAPRNFRLQASMPIGGNDLADLGSNDERFWFWMRPENEDENAILTARHDCLAAAQQSLPMPFEPEWLIEALGVIPLEESEIDFEKSPDNPKHVFFRRKRHAPNGSPVELVSTVDTCAGVIVDHSLSDRAGNMIALARLSEHYHEGKSGPVLPHLVELSWPQANMGIKLTMGAIEVNPDRFSSKQFAMPEIANCRIEDIGGETQQASDTGRSKV